MKFPVDFSSILERVAEIDPVRYGTTRNFADGAVSYLSPYISRGVISTRQIMESVLQKGYSPYAIEKFIQELAWRDYWQQSLIANGEKINSDLKRSQPKGLKEGLPVNILHHQTGIEAIDDGIKSFYKTGYLHNHLRMYIASLSCNMAQCKWKMPAQWMYYHLLDADWGSNALSWQWVAGSNSNKLYYANQENINKYFYTHQLDTFLDIGYDQFENMDIPMVLSEIVNPELTTILPDTAVPVLDPMLPTLVYNFYNIDPQWHKEMKANRVLLLEPSVFEKYPVSEKSIRFCCDLATQNIPGIQIWVAEFQEVKAKLAAPVYFKEHPLNHYEGNEESRDWMSSVKGDYPSFFAFWKKLRKELF